MNVQAKSYKLNHSSFLIEAGNTSTLKLSNLTKVTWSSKNESIATVSKKGVVTAKKAGSTVITAAYKGKKYACKVQVYKVGTGNKTIDKKMKAVIQKNISPGMTTIEKVKAIHDWIILNCEYDYDSYLNNQIPQHSFSIQGVMLHGKAVCAGYTETFASFMKALGIACKEVSGFGNGESHAWNMVKINGKWSWIDVTWDDPVPDIKGEVFYNYFLLSDDEMKKDHLWSTTGLPKCSTPQSQYTNKVVDLCESEDDFINMMYKQYKSGNNTVTTYMSSKLLNKIMDDFYSMIDIISSRYHLRFCGYNVSYTQYMGDIVKVEYTFDMSD